MHTVWGYVFSRSSPSFQQHTFRVLIELLSSSSSASSASSSSLSSSVSVLTCAQLSLVRLTRTLFPWFPRVEQATVLRAVMWTDALDTCEVARNTITEREESILDTGLNKGHLPSAVRCALLCRLPITDALFSTLQGSSVSLPMSPDLSAHSFLRCIFERAILDMQRFTSSPHNGNHSDRNIRSQTGHSLQLGQVHSIALTLTTLSGLFRRSCLVRVASTLTLQGGARDEKPVFPVLSHLIVRTLSRLLELHCANSQAETRQINGECSHNNHTGQIHTRSENKSNGTSGGLDWAVNAALMSLSATQLMQALDTSSLIHLLTLCSDCYRTIPNTRLSLAWYEHKDLYIGVNYVFAPVSLFTHRSLPPFLNIFVSVLHNSFAKYNYTCFHACGTG